MNDMETYRDLITWKKAMEMVTAVYEQTRRFPKEELYGLTAQIRRCAVSIPSNIAEGYGRGTSQEYLRFLKIAAGSLYELETQMQIALNLGYLTNDHFDGLSRSFNEIERLLLHLISKIEAKL